MWNRLCEAPNWASILLARFGMPWQVTDYEAPVMMAGDTAAFFGDAEIDQMLRRAIVLDGIAAAILAERGYEALIGVRTEKKETLRINFERYGENKAFYGRYAGTRNYVESSNVPRLIPVSDTVRVISEFISVPAYQSTEESVVTPAVTLYVDENGGRVAVFWVVPGLGGLGTLNDRIKSQLIGVLGWVAGAPIPVWTVGTADTFLRFGRLSDTEYLMGVINLNPDAISPLVVEMPVYSTR